MWRCFRFFFFFFFLFLEQSVTESIVEIDNHSEAYFRCASHTIRENTTIDFISYGNFNGYFSRTNYSHYCCKTHLLCKANVKGNEKQFEFNLNEAFGLSIKWLCVCVCTYDSNRFVLVCVRRFLFSFVLTEVRWIIE
jgi:hypothetical protein